MSLDCAIGLLVIGTLIAMMVATGPGVRLAEIAGAAPVAPDRIARGSALMRRAPTF